MVIFQSLGPSMVFVSERKAKAEIRKIENANQAIRDAVDAKVAVSTKPTPAEKREEALQKVRDENLLFSAQVDIGLLGLLQSSNP